jgi:hypothetical protein
MPADFAGPIAGDSAAGPTPPLPPNFNLTKLEQELAQLKITCTLCLILSLVAALPIVVTGLLVRERRTFPSRITTIFLVKIMLMNVVVIGGASVDYRIPSRLNELIFTPQGLPLMNQTLCKVQAMAYQFLIWCVMSFYLVLTYCLYRVVTSTTETTDFRNLEVWCYAVAYGVSVFFTVVPLVVDQTVGNGEVFRADANMLWCWLTAENATDPLDQSMAFVPWSQIIFFYSWLVVYFGIGVAFSFKILGRLIGERVIITRCGVVTDGWVVSE